MENYQLWLKRNLNTVKEKLALKKSYTRAKTSQKTETWIKMSKILSNSENFLSAGCCSFYQLKICSNLFYNKAEEKLNLKLSVQEPQILLKYSINKVISIKRLKI